MSLLKCARRVAEALNATPADVPVEGYYAEDAQLTEYFRLVRTLQHVDDGATSLVDSLPEFQRLRDVTCIGMHTTTMRSSAVVFGLGATTGFCPYATISWAICRDEHGEFAVQEFWKSRSMDNHAISFGPSFRLAVSRALSVRPWS